MRCVIKQGSFTLIAEDASDRDLLAHLNGANEILRVSSSGDRDGTREVTLGWRFGSLVLSDRRVEGSA